MAIVEAFFESLLPDLVQPFFRLIGACVRWIFLRNRYTFSQIRQQEWNGRVGLLVVACVVTVVVIYLHRSAMASV